MRAGRQGGSQVHSSLISLSPLTYVLSSAIGPYLKLWEQSGQQHSLYCFGTPLTNDLEGGFPSLVTGGFVNLRLLWAVCMWCGAKGGGACYHLSGLISFKLFNISYMYLLSKYNIMCFPMTFFSHPWCPLSVC